MTYSRLEINLLPPELRPSPAVQISTMLVLILVLLTAAGIAIDVTLSMFRLMDLKNQKIALEQQLADKATITQEYNELITAGNSIGRFGRVVALTTLEYIDMPLVLERVSRILPDGVYIQEIGSDRRRNRGEPVSLVLLLHVARTDPWLIHRTLTAFKEDQLFSNCYLKSARYGELQLDQYKQLFGINWVANGPDIPGSLLAPEYQVEIHVRLEGPLPEVRPAVLNRYDWFQDFQLNDAAPDKNGEGSAPADQGGAAANAPTGQAGKPPAGVSVAEVH